MDFRNFLTVTRFTIQDELHNRSFYVFTAVAILFVLLLRGCFGSNMNVNGQALNSTTIGYYTSIVAFNIIAAAGALIGVLLAMRLIRRDRDDGMAATVLAKPVKRIDYMAGKVAGVWILSYIFTLILHITVYIIMLVHTGGRIPFFFPASLITSMNVLFAVIMVMFFATMLPDVMAALVTIGIAAISLGTDSIAALSKNISIESSSNSIWHYISIAWPKLAALQFYSTTLIKETAFQSSNVIHPVFNVLIYCIIGGALLFWKFSREELQ